MKPNKIGAFLRSERLKKGISSKGMERLTGISITNLKRIEEGNGFVVVNLVKLCDVLGVVVTVAGQSVTNLKATKGKLKGTKGKTHNRQPLKPPHTIVEFTIDTYLGSNRKK